MNKKEVLLILSGVINDQNGNLLGYLTHDEDLVDYLLGDKDVFLQGSFTINTLKAIVWYMENE